MVGHLVLHLFVGIDETEVFEVRKEIFNGDLDGFTANHFVGMEECEPEIHLWSCIGARIDAFESENFKDTMEPPALFGREDPFEIVGTIVKFIAVLVVSFEFLDPTGCRIESGGGSGSMEGD